MTEFWLVSEGAGKSVMFAGDTISQGASREQRCPSLRCVHAEEALVVGDEGGFLGIGGEGTDVAGGDGAALYPSIGGLESLDEAGPLDRVVCPGVR